MLIRDKSGEDGLQVDVPAAALDTLPALFTSEAQRQGVTWTHLAATIAATKTESDEDKPPGEAGDTSDAMLNYLEANDVAAKLNAAVNELALSQPEDPMAFLAALLGRS